MSEETNPPAPPMIAPLVRDECNSVQWQSQSIFMAKLLERVLVNQGFPCQVMHDPDDPLKYHTILVGDAARIRCVGQFCDFELYDESGNRMITHSVNIYTIVNRLIMARKKAEERAKHKEEAANRPDYEH
jgi:hypothetical protein